MEGQVLPTNAVIALPQRSQKQPRNRRANQKQEVVVLQRNFKQNQLSKSQRKRLNRKKKNITGGVTFKDGISQLEQFNHLGDSDYPISTQMMSPVEQIAFSICAPMNAPTQRYVSEYSVQETAVANPFERVTANWLTSGSGTLGVAATDLPCFVFRNAERAAVLFDANPTSASWGYQIRGLDETAQLPQPSWIAAVSTGTPESLKTPFAVALTDYKPHGDYLFAGRPEDFKQGRFLWLNSTDLLSGTITVAVAAGTTYDLILELDYWDSDEGYVAGKTLVLRSLAFAGPSVSFTNVLLSSLAANPGSGYYSYRITGNVYDAGDLDVGGRFNVTFSGFTITSTGQCFGHRSMKDYALNVASCNGVRVQGAAVRYCNTAAQLSLEGKIAMYQVPLAKHWKEFLTYGKVASAKDSASMDVKEGGYCFLKPTQAEDIDLQVYTQTKDGQLVDSYYPLKEVNGFLAIYPQIITADGRSGFFEICHPVEFSTTDVWKNTQLPQGSDDLFKQANYIVRGVPQYHKNSPHIGNIFRSIKSFGSKVLGGVAKYGPQAISTAAKLAPLLL